MLKEGKLHNYQKYRTNIGEFIDPVYEKMLNIPNHQGNANQKHSEIVLHTCQNYYH